MTNRPFKVLFICTGNSARSQMAEAILNRDGEGKFCAFSAGTRPTGEVHPLALHQLERNGYRTDKLRSKSLDEFQGDGVPDLDFVFTVCDTAANEECPVWPGHTISAHWGMPDPVKVSGTDAERSLAFANTHAQLYTRLQLLVNLPFENLDRMSLQSRLDEIGTTDQASAA